MKKNFPMKSDLFNMQTVYDYAQLIKNQSENKVIKSKKTFIKESESHNKIHMNRTTNK